MTTLDGLTLFFLALTSYGIGARDGWVERQRLAPSVYQPAMPSAWRRVAMIGLAGLYAVAALRHLS